MTGQKQEASNVALDILVDVLEHFVQSFLGTLRSLARMHQIDVNADEPHLAANFFYSSHASCIFSTFCYMYFCLSIFQSIVFILS